LLVKDSTRRIYEQFEELAKLISTDFTDSGPEFDERMSRYIILYQSQFKKHEDEAEDGDDDDDDDEAIIESGQATASAAALVSSESDSESDSNNE
jgi:hypothetical protein